MNDWGAAPDPEGAAWMRLLASGDAEGPLHALFAPVMARPTAADGCVVIGRLAQSLDGRIATSTGASFWIGGEGDLLHTHRLRALCDAVVIGAGTVRTDNPLLTTRRCPGPSPVRVVLDTDRRLDAAFRIFQAPPRTLLFCADDAPDLPPPGFAELVRVPRATAGGLEAAAVLGALGARGLRRLFVEGGGLTVSRFLAAGALDRLHVTLAPLLLGAGIPAFTLPCPGSPSHGLRFDWTVHRLGADLLLDIPLHRARPPACT